MAQQVWIYLFHLSTKMFEVMTNAYDNGRNTLTYLICVNLCDMYNP